MAVEADSPAGGGVPDDSQTPGEGSNRSIVPPDSSPPPNEPPKGSGDPQGGSPPSGGDGLSGDPWFKGWVQPDGTLDHTKLDQAAEELKESSKLREFKRFDDFVKSFVHQQGMLGKKGLLPLRPDASDSEKEAHMEALRSATGAPKDADGYLPNMERPESHPEEMWDEEYAKGVAEILHQHAAPPSLAKALVEHNSKWALSEMEKAKEAQQQSEDKHFDEQVKKLKDSWGYRFDEEAKLASKAARHFGLDPESEAFRLNADVVMAMAKAGRLVKESEFVDQSGWQSPMQNAKSEAERMMNDKTHPLYEAMRDKSHPDYKKAVAEFDRLTRAMSPT